MKSAILTTLTGTGLGIWSTLGLLYLSWLVYKLVLAFRRAKSLEHHPGFRGIFALATIVGRLIPRDIPYVNESLSFAWRTRRRAYNRHRTSILSDIAMMDNKSYFFCSTPSAVRQLNMDRKTFRKPVEVYEILKYFGSNVVVTEGEEWRRHRKIVAPGFNEAVLELVWKTTTEIYFEMAGSKGWTGMSPGETVEVPDVPELMLKMALTVLATASFGAPLSWSETPQTARPDGHEMSFVEAITGVSENMFLTILLPDILFRLPFKKIQHVGTAVRELKSHMYGMIQERKEEIRRGETGANGVRRDLFNQLIEASLEEEKVGGGDDDEKAGGAGKGLTDEELVGNTFIFALAGHETSAHTLAFAFGYLACNPDVQEWLFQELLQVMPDGHLPSYKDFAKLPRTLAVLYETLRLHPSVNIIPKYATEDTFLLDDPDSWFDGEDESTSTPDDREKEEKRKVFVPAGTQCQIDVVNLHRHPVYWPNPHAFRPERFMEDYEKDAFVPFSAGARGCIGRRFAEVESVAFIAMLIRHFRLSPARRSTPPGETPEQTSDRVLRAKGGITLTPVKVELDFTRRDGEGVGRPEFTD